MKRLKQAAVIAAGAALAASAAAYITSFLWAETALSRNTPKVMGHASGKISGGTKKDEAFLEACRKASDALKNKNHETVRITARDGIELIGHYFPCENAKRVIVAFHGWRSSWHYDYGLISPFWEQNCCSVLYVEQRGQNASGGEYMGFGLTERFDCADWVNFAVCRAGKEIPIYLAGISMGAATVLMASDLNLPKNVHGIMADCGFTSPKAVFRHVAEKNLHMHYGMYSILLDAMCKKRICFAAGDCSAPNALSKTDIPILFVHGSDDRFVPVEMTYENYKACRAPKRLLVVPGADHAASYYVDKNNYEQAVLKFWSEFDKKSI